MPSVAYNTTVAASCCCASQSNTGLKSVPPRPSIGIVAGNSVPSNSDHSCTCWIAASAWITVSRHGKVSRKARSSATISPSTFCDIEPEVSIANTTCPGAATPSEGMYRPRCKCFLLNG